MKDAIAEILDRVRRLGDDEQLMALWVATMCLSQERLNDRLANPDAYHREQADQLRALKKLEAVVSTGPDPKAAARDHDRRRAVAEAALRLAEDVRRLDKPGA